MAACRCSKALGALPGGLGQLPGIKDPPQFVQPSKKQQVERPKDETQAGGE
jgi:hypothetical protein